MSSVHSFREKLAEGEAGEGYLDTYFEEWFVIRKVNRTGQRAGIDRVFTDRLNPMRVERIEYKTDRRAGATRNAFVETVSVDAAGKSGWAYTSQADTLVYYVPPLGLAYVIAFPNLRAELPSWLLRYRQASAQNEGYRTFGVLVPLREFERIATQVVQP